MMPFPDQPESQEIQALRIIYQGVSFLVASFDDLTAATQQLVNEQHAISGGMQNLSASVERLITDWDAIKAQGILTTAQQAQLDASVQAVTSAAADMATQAAAMSTEQANVDTADPQRAQAQRHK
jgi:hypothetical protein